jgi:hypothetical protein
MTEKIPIQFEWIQNVVTVGILINNLPFSFIK